MKASGKGMFIGNLIGIHAVLVFSFFCRPGRWLFASLDGSQAIVAYGYCLMLFMAASVMLGAYLPPLCRAALTALQPKGEA